MGIIAGGTAAILSTKPNAAGDAARAAGDVGILVGEKALAIDEKHHVTLKGRELAAGLGNKLKESDYGEKGTKIAREAWEGAKEVDRRNGVVEGVTRIVGTVIESVGRGLRRVGG